MSGRLVKDVLRYAPSDLTDKELLVLIALAEDARERDRIARFITVEDLVERTRSTAGHVRNILSELTSRLLIFPTLNHANKGRRQVYRIAFLTEEHRYATTRPQCKKIRNRQQSSPAPNGATNEDTTPGTSTKADGGEITSPRSAPVAAAPWSRNGKNSVTISVPTKQARQ